MSDYDRELAKENWKTAVELYAINRAINDELDRLRAENDMVYDMLKSVIDKLGIVVKHPGTLKQMLLAYIEYTQNFDIEFDTSIKDNANLRVENARLRAALEAVEFVDDWDEYCPWCKTIQEHAHDCQRQIALGLMPQVQGACDPDWNEIKAAEQEQK